MVDLNKASKEELDEWFTNSERPNNTDIRKYPGLVRLIETATEPRNPEETAFWQQRYSKLPLTKRMDSLREARLVTALLGATDIPLSASMRAYMTLVLVTVLYDTRTLAQKKTDQQLDETYAFYAGRHEKRRGGARNLKQAEEMLAAERGLTRGTLRQRIKRNLKKPRRVK
jgi:hypothetical protein